MTNAEAFDALDAARLSLFKLAALVDALALSCAMTGDAKSLETPMDAVAEYARTILAQLDAISIDPRDVAQRRAAANG